MIDFLKEKCNAENDEARFTLRCAMHTIGFFTGIAEKPEEQPEVIDQLLQSFITGLSTANAATGNNLQLSAVIVRPMRGVN